MAQLFVTESSVRDATAHATDGSGGSAAEREWCVAPLDAPMFALVPQGDALGVRRVRSDSLAAAAGEHPLLIVGRGGSGADDDECEWFVLARTPVALNGRSLANGIAALAHADELRVGAARAFFSLERQARVERHAGQGDAHCPRCQLPVEPGQSAVRCPAPQCGVLHHEDAARELPCWTDFERCATCPQPTALDAGLRWTPAAL